MNQHAPKPSQEPRLSLWVIEPAAAYDDPAWMDRQQFEHVIVRAESPAFARQLAVTLDTPAEAHEYGQQDPALGSAFLNPRMYHVLPVHYVKSQLEGEPAVIDSKKRLPPRRFA